MNENTWVDWLKDAAALLLLGGVLAASHVWAWKAGVETCYNCGFDAGRMRPLHVITSPSEERAKVIDEQWAGRGEVVEDTP